MPVRRSTKALLLLSRTSLSLGFKVTAGPLDRVPSEGYESPAVWHTVGVKLRCLITSQVLQISLRGDLHERIRMWMWMLAYMISGERQSQHTLKYVY